MTSMYHSTRNADACVSAKRAVLNGLASDGGLYVTDALGETKIDLERVVTNTYRENAAYILGTHCSMTIPLKKLSRALRLHTKAPLKPTTLLPW